MKRFKLTFTNNPVFSSVTGLLNKTFDKNNYVSGRAATEDQLASLASSIETDTNTITTVDVGDGLEVIDNGEDGNHDYTIKLASQLSVGSTEQGSTDNPVFVDGISGTIDGLTNTTWDGTGATSGQAATEDQLAGLQTLLEDKIDSIDLEDKTDVLNGNDIVVDKSGDNFTVNLIDDYMVYSLSPNIIVTGDDLYTLENYSTNSRGYKNEYFVYNLTNGDISATSNQIQELRGDQKIILQGTSLPGPTIQGWGTPTDGVYWDETNRNLLYNGNAFVHIISGSVSPTKIVIG